ncbi:MAG: MFS transporter [Elusimicrobiota bacterium]
MLSGILSKISWDILVPVLPPRILNIVGSATLTGIIMGSAPVLTLVFRKTISEYIRSYGSKVFIITGIIMALAGSAGFAISDNFWTLLLARTVQGSGLILFFFSSLSLVTHLIPAGKRGQLYGIYTIIFILPLLFSPLIGTYVVDNFSFFHLIVISVSCLTASLLLALNIREKEKKYVKRSPDKNSLTALLKNKKALIALILTLIIITGDAGILTFLPIAAELHHLEKFSLYFTFFAGSTIILRLTLGKYFDRFSRKKIIFTGVLFLCAGLFMLSKVTFNFLIAGAVVYGIGYGITDSNLLPYLLKVLKNSPSESVVALYSISFDCGYLFGPLFLGAVAEKTSYPILFKLLGITIFLTGIVFMMLNRKKHNDIPG